MDPESVLILLRILGEIRDNLGEINQSLQRIGDASWEAAQPEKSE